MALARKALLTAALVLAVVAHVRAADADTDVDAQTAVSADATAWAHLSHEQLMALGVWGADPCTRETVPGFDYARGFAEFCKRFGKVYAAKTYPLRFAAWKASYNCIAFKNRTAPKRSYYLRMNHLNDHTREEFLRKLGARESPELVGTPAKVPGPNFQLRTTTPTVAAPGHGPSAAHKFRQTFEDAAEEVDAEEDELDADDEGDEGEGEADSADEDVALLQTTTRVRKAKRALVGGDDHSGQSFDWRAKGVVNPVGYQQNCGNCWAFSAAAVAEAAWAIAGNTLRKISVAHVTDCAPKPAKGCGGGMAGEALNSLMKAGGFCADSQYPFRGYSDTCKPCDKVVQLADVPRNYFTEKNESSLFGYLAVSPVSVALVASPVTFMNYGGGVYDAAECNAADVRTNHALTLVGYGTDPEHGDYWVVRNQWATSWGENGYMRLKRGVNQCKIASGMWAIAKSKPAAELGLTNAPASTPPLGPDVAPFTACAATDPNSKVTFHGTCQDVQACTDAKMYPQPKLCPGSASVQCCLRVPLTGPAIPAPVAPAVAPATPAAPVTPPRPVQQSCSALHPTKKVVAAGACIDSGICNAANNLPVAGACPGAPANVKCCLSK